MRSIDEIYAALAADYESAGSLVLREGGDMSLRLYAVASQIFALENQLAFSRRQAFPQTAEGEYLDRHASVRGLERSGGSCASGVLRFFVESAAQTDIPVDAGVICTDARGTSFVTVENGVIKAGELYCDLACKAKEPGAEGNMPAGAVCYMPLPPVGVSGCQNPAPITGGSAGESDESLRERILASYSSLPNGANIAYYEEQAKSVEGVGAVQVLPRHRGVGTVDVVIAAPDGVPAQKTVEAVSDLLEQQREICVDIQVRAPETSPVNLTVQLASADFESAKTAVENALGAYFDGTLLGKNVLLAKLNSVIFAAPGVDNCRITEPAADIPGGEGVLPVLGTLEIAEMEV